MDFYCSAIDIFGSGLGDTFYPSNELDPYIKDKDVSYIIPYSNSHFVFDFQKLQL